MMNLVADESLDYPIVLALRAKGHTVFSVLENLAGINDEAVLSFARNHKSVLITSDKDFGELVYRLKKISSGIILLRLAGLSNSDKINLVVSTIKEHEPQLLNAFTVITQNSIRIRKFE